ncbi:MAG: RNA 2',3'-cyclic phosphodiesterase [Candidatus Eremiobacteraeota bacterium]|nr:RNA 2',3'-cyclic phosphodiesterase [Candidatus Eremiobacteraeota bacterium]
MTKDLRLFIAVPIQLKLKRKFFNLVNQLKSIGANVKWVKEENFHITLKFLGDTPESRLDEVESAIRSALEGFSPARLKFGGIGAFPNFRRPSVLWIGLESGYEELSAIAGNLEDSLERLGYEREHRKFRSHLTIGRVKSQKGVSKLMEKAEFLKKFDGGNMKLTHIYLMKSDLGPSGPTYTVLREFPLTSPPQNEFSGSLF